MRDRSAVLRTCSSQGDIRRHWLLCSPLKPASLLSAIPESKSMSKG